MTNSKEGRLTEMTEDGIFRELTPEESLEVYNSLREDIKKVYDGRDSLPTKVKERVEEIYSVIFTK